ncbi:MAG: DUF3800 domain-containing protein [Candidatus Gracilibacteria bacterium]|nr:DUF3800 domain-containing protein [Candidatus Gracilibacteria bacterium]
MIEEQKNKKILYIFIDESGDFTFSGKSSKHFYLSGLAIRAFDSTIPGKLYDIRHDLLTDVDIYNNEKKDLEYFHATEDIQITRDAVFNLIGTLDPKFTSLYSVVTQKNKANPIFHDAPEKYFSKHVVWLMQGILYSENISDFDEMRIFFDDMPVAKNKKAMFKNIKGQINDFFEEKGIRIPYYMYAHQSKSHIYLQIADYMSWAINVHCERNESRPIEIIRKFIVNIFKPFESGTKIYYEYLDTKK